MRFSDLAKELRKYLFLGTSKGEFVLCLIDSILREPFSTHESERDERGYLNPLRSVSPETCRQYLAGTAYISRSNAEAIYGRFNSGALVDLIDELPPKQKEQLNCFLKQNGLDVKVEDLGVAVGDILEQLFDGMAQRKHDINVRIRLYDGKPRIDSLPANRVRYDKESNTIIIDGESISLPVTLTEEDINRNESRFISELCAAYADAMESIISVEDIDNLPIKYKENYADQIEAYLSAEGIQRSLREVYEDGENQFDILKKDAYYGIRSTYKDDYPNGYKRLNEVLKQVTNVQLNESKLILITNLIGSLQKLGIVHILVEEGTIPSWVDPYKEIDHE